MKNKSSTIIKAVIGCFVLATILFNTNLKAQTTEVIEGKLFPYELKKELLKTGPCVSKAEREAIKARVQQNKAMLIADGKLDGNHTTAVGAHAFRWPLASDKNYHQFSTYYISNYLDLNSTSSGNPASDPGETLEDYNCGNRTYDVNTGYDHDGIDISTGPFGWKMMDNDDVDVVAVEGGVISDRHEGEFDRTCDLPSPNVYHGNYIGITHSDGTSTFYMHMKSGSVTNKVVGDVVSVGEYLGKVGSSGNSSGPHLHFEVQDNNGNILDPFQSGSCATGTHPSLWANEEPYYNKQIVSLFTLSAPWTNASCDVTGQSYGTSEIVPYCNHFNAGDAVWFSAALRDIASGQLVNIKIYNPSGTLIYNFNYTESSTYRSLRIIAPNFFIAPNVGGNYKMQCTYNGVIRAHYFTVGCPGSITLSNTRSSNYGFISGGNIASTDSIISSARNVQYQAETYIQFNPGFRAVTGCEFTARIDNCTIGNPKFGDETTDANSTFDFTLIPNPADGGFQVSSLEFQAVDEIKVFDAVGKMIYQTTIGHTERSRSVETSSWDNGIYFVQLITASGEKSSTKKLIVNH